MNFQDLLQELSLGDLNNMHMANEGTGGIHETQISKIVHYTNTALTILYTRFLVKTRDVLVAMQPSISYYHLNSLYAQSQFDPEKAAVAYILDLGNEPFTDDVLQMLYVVDSQGNEIPLNQPTKPNSVYSPQATILHVPTVADGEILCIGYRAAHPKMTGDYLQEMEVPVTLVPALTAYIAYLVYNNLNTQEGFANAQNRLQMFENICTMVESAGTLDNSFASYAERFRANGWA